MKRKEIKFICTVCKKETTKMSFGYIPLTCGLECQRKLMSDKYTGRKLPQETINKLKGRIGWNIGIPATPEAIERLRKANLGRKASLETRQKISQKSTGRMHTKETKDKLRIFHLGKIVKQETRQKISNSLKGKSCNKGSKHSVPSWAKGKKFPERCGENHWAWKKDRNTLVKKQERNDSAYGAWRREVWTRDNFKCKINNEDCNGRIEAHHILPWRDYENLRYQINNGITLCHFHHPRKVEDEKRLSPFFMELVSVSSDKF